MARAVLVLLLLAGAAAGVARADGLPVLGIDVGSTGVTVPDSAERFVTLPVRHGTLVARVERRGGRVVTSRLLAGTFTIPAVAYDGSAGGLSADGRVLALIEPRLAFPRANTTFALLDAPGLRLRKVVRLRGDFSFDAVSPRGDRLYLIQYLSPRDATRYAVRAYDVGAARLLPKPIVDPHEAGEQMRGQPVSRATSPDGRWAYTLYDGAGKEPFVHALDTSRSTARCIDLDELGGTRDLWMLRLRVDGRRLLVHDHKGARLVVDRATFRVREPAPPQPVRLAADGSKLTWPWALGASGLAVAIAAGAAVAAIRRRRPALG